MITLETMQGLAWNTTIPPGGAKEMTDKINNAL